MTTPPDPLIDPPVPMFEESIGGALIDAARINVMAAQAAFPELPPVIVLPGDEDDPPTIGDCLAQAAQWLDAARAMTIEQAPAAPTSLHVVEGAQRG